MNQLKDFREEALMTVRELSERSGVSEDTITKIENGHRKGRPVTLRKLAQALDIDHRELVESTSRSAGHPSLEAPKGRVYEYEPESETYSVRLVESWFEEYENKLAKIRSE